MPEPDSEDHPLTQRYNAGHRAWNAGEVEEARRIWRALWEDAHGANDHYHACGAAHMLGLLDPTPMTEKLEWHLRSLRHADALGPAYKSFYASIYSNLGRSYLHLGDSKRASTCYWKAWAHADVLGDSDYARGVRDSIRRGLEQLGETPPQPAEAG
jgi:tetratricopeptide (TPR) repeat protein